MKKLPICTAPVQIHPNPTVWLSDFSAKDWIYRIQMKHYGSGCPAGEPCPETGCPVCCPSYDPCNNKSCTFRCNNPRLEKNLSHTDEEQQAMACTHSCLTDGMNYPECPVHGEGEVTGELAEQLRAAMAEAKTLRAEESGYPFLDGDILVLGPEIFVNLSGDTISWKGQSYQRLKPSVAEAPSDVPDYRRREAMDWSVRLHEAALRSGNFPPATTVMEDAQKIYDWLVQK